MDGRERGPTVRVVVRGVGAVLMGMRKRSDNVDSHLKRTATSDVPIDRGDVHHGEPGRPRRGEARLDLGLGVARTRPKPTKDGDVKRV